MSCLETRHCLNHNFTNDKDYLFFRYPRQSVVMSMEHQHLVGETQQRIAQLEDSLKYIQATKKHLKDNAQEVRKENIVLFILNKNYSKDFFLRNGNEM